MGKGNKLLSTLLFFLVITGCSQLWAGLPDTVEKIKNSVVAVGTILPIRGTKSPDSPLTFRGTGFVVGNGRQVVTNFHVIQKPLNDSKQERLAIFSGEGKTSKVYPAKVVKTDPAHDLALLEFTGPPQPAMGLSTSDNVREGQDVAFTGFPLGLVLGLQPVTHRGIVSSVAPFVMPALSSKMLTPEQIARMRQPFIIYQLDATAYPGNSGSPVYDIQSGEVFAVINSVFVKKSRESMLKDPSDISYAIPVTHVKALLTQAREE